MEITNHRLAHSIAVARKMYELSLKRTNDKEYAKEMFFLGYIHDIGYEFSEMPMEHTIAGAKILKNCGYKYWKEVLYHGLSNPPYTSQELDLLNIADLTTNSRGADVTAKNRCDITKEIYGEDSLQFKESVSLANKLQLL